MDDSHYREVRENGFVRLPRLAGGEALARLRGAAACLAELARGRAASDAHFVLEAPGIGGWAAWQQGTGALPGVLRSADRIHEHVPEFDAVQRALDLAGGPVAGAAGGRAGTLVNAFLWAKPPVVGSAKPWHQDMAFAPPAFGPGEHGIVTVWIALEPATLRNGCLEFIPGSHVLGMFPHTGDRERLPGEPPVSGAVEPHVADGHLPSTPAVAVELEPGSAVMFDGMVLHRSAPNTTAGEPRTAVSFVYRVPRPAWTRTEPAVVVRG
ncbi:phytanoyl-CoA dioxygenase family protein [Streptomyces sp. NPDC057092]|uniref:phytanoyl-CoA dioxygenase family protein n=1 Tax=Streptomyces sp. NPDC057092 TaxID=3346017 RepID=UPI00362D6A4E